MSLALGFLGTGWIGRDRMAALVAAGHRAVAVADPDDEAAAAALALCPGAVRVDGLAAMLALRPDGIVIATPSAQHAAEAIAALAAGVPVFCQKPLGRDAAEVRAVVDAAARADRRLGVDLSYRHTAAAAAIARLLQGGALGRVFAVDLTFHNAWGPGKPWFFDRRLSGGGCVVDLGVHLVDLALWWLGGDARVTDARLHANGAPLTDRHGSCEDHAVATLEHDSGAVIRLACSWNLPAGQEAVIAARLYGTGGGAELANVGGSFYDFVAHRFDGIRREVLAEPPDAWGPRAALAWAEAVARAPGHDAEATSLVTVARLLDGIYAHGLGDGQALAAE